METAGIGSLSGILPSRQTHILSAPPATWIIIHNNYDQNKAHHKGEAVLLVETATTKNILQAFETMAFIHLQEPQLPLMLPPNWYLIL